MRPDGLTPLPAFGSFIEKSISFAERRVCGAKYTPLLNYFDHRERSHWTNCIANSIA